MASTWTPRGRYVVAAGANSASVILTQEIAGNHHVRTVSLTAVGADVRYNWGAAATASSFYLKNGETVYMDVPFSEVSDGGDPVLHAIRNASTDGTIEVIAWGDIYGL
tara:strand:- start:167 stop:490 length:324 start_codon:yes stop_codon:yes gene_type:complete